MYVFLRISYLADLECAVSFAFGFCHRPSPFCKVKFNPWAKQWILVPNTFVCWVAARMSLPLSDIVAMIFDSRPNLGNNMPTIKSTGKTNGIRASELID